MQYDLESPSSVMIFLKQLRCISLPRSYKNGKLQYCGFATANALLVGEILPAYECWGRVPSGRPT